jgi:thiamine pyrophosphokinase
MTLQEQLKDAQKAYHELLTGRSARVVVDGADGSRIEYTAANRQALYNYILELQTKVNLESPTPTRFNNGPAGFVF